MFRLTRVRSAILLAALPVLAAGAPSVLPPDPQQRLERTCFQTAAPWSGIADLRSDVAIAYGLDPSLPQRIQTWRERGYCIHVMTGVSWGSYQDYLYGRLDGVNHEDEAQTDAAGNKISHGGDVYYMCPGTNYGKFLCRGVQRALDAGAEAIHLEEPEFWVQPVVTLVPGLRFFLIDLDAVRSRQPRVLTSACKALPAKNAVRSLSLTVEGAVNTPAVVPLRAPAAPRSVTLVGQPLENLDYSPEDRLLWIRFTNEARPRELGIEF